MLCTPKKFDLNKNKYKKIEEDKIKKENQRIIEKIIFKTSDLNKNKFLNEYEKHVIYKKNLQKQPDYQNPEQLK